jgi:hypothetical protein
MTKLWGRVCAGALAAAAAGMAGTAGAAPADEGLDLHLGYDGRLLFIKVLDLTLNEQITPGGHASSARIASYGVLDAVKHFNIEAAESGPLAHGAPQPGVFRHENHDGKRNRKVEVVWTAEDVTTTAKPEMTFLGDPPATREQKLGAVGYLTALARLTLSAEHGPCTGAERIFNGKELSQIGFSDPQPTPLSPADKKLGLVNGISCHASFQEVAGYKKKTGKARNQGLDRPITVQFAQVGDGGPWVAARMQAHTMLGSAVIELARVEIHGHLPEDLVQASR